VYGSSTSEQPYVREWQGWSQWCAASEVHVLTLADQAEVALAAGCDPAVSPDGRRIAYASPPKTEEPGFQDEAPLIINSIRLINRQGQNGWDFAKALGAHTGRVVYAPSWSPDGSQVVYQRFLGYQVLVDIGLSEIGGSFEGKGQLFNVGAGWLLPARFAPDGRSVAIVENNYSDARGFGGYDNWSVSVVTLAGSREVALPSETLTAVGQRVDLLQRGQSAAWAPDGSALAVGLPPGWRADLPPDEPVGAEEQPGEVWRWQPGGQPAERLFDGVDFASPLAWLPAR
jgi:Tol biopolymer transport system component